MSSRKKAIWWFSPSLLEPCDGPWGKMSDFGHDPVLAWKGIIDWAAELKVTHLIPGIEPYTSDRVYNQWGFHYVCHFPEDESARCFDEETIGRNIDTLRQICKYGIEKNVKIMFHHYNLMAPENWIKSHPSLLEKYNNVHDPVWGHKFRNDRMGFMVSNVCWNEPDYKAFLQRCWQEVFKNVPELAGIMITAGEFNHCGCDKCTGGIPSHIFQGQNTADDKVFAEQKATRDKLRGEMCVDLISTLKSNMDSLDKELIVRSWVMPKWADVLPKGIEYATKYSLFDACWGGPDPVVNDWIDAGHNMLETVAIEAENCGPVLWHDEKWNREVGKINNDLDIGGCIIHINFQWGHTGHIGSFTSSRNITRMLEALEPVVEGKSSEEEYIEFFGEECGKDVCRAAELIATFPLHMTSTVHLASEGFSYGMPPWFDGGQRWPGVLGSDRYRPPEWANPDHLTNIYQLLQMVKNSPECYSELIENQRHTAMTRCDEIAVWCKEAINILDACVGKVSPESRSELKALIAGAHIAEDAAIEHAAVLRARIAWEAVKSSSSIAGKAREDAVKHYEAAVTHLARQISWGLEMSKVYPDVANHVTESHETFNRLTMAARLRIRKAELELIKTVEGPDWEEKMTINFWPHLPNSIGSHAKP